MARNRIQFQKGLWEARFGEFYGTEELCRAAVADSDATRTVIPIHCGHDSDDRGQLVTSG